MKHKLLALLSLVIILYLAACRANQQATPSPTVTDDSAVAGSLVVTPSSAPQLTQSDLSPTRSATAQTAKNVEYVGHIDGASLAVVIQGNLMYLGIGHKLEVFEISDPASLRAVGKSEPLPGIVVDFIIVDGLAYVADDEAGMWIVDIVDPANPTLSGFYSIPKYAVHDEVSELKYDDVASMAVENGHAYVAEYQYGIRVVDISDPANPVEVGFYDTPGDAHGVVVVGEIAYVADFDQGLRVLNIADPAQPVEIGSYDTPGEAQSLTIAGEYVYVADGSDGMHVINIADPAHPVLAGSLDTSGYTQGVTIEGAYAYLADGSAGLVVVNIADPANPVIAGAYDTPGYAWGVGVADEIVYVADANGGLAILRFVGE